MAVAAYDNWDHQRGGRECKKGVPGPTHPLSGRQQGRSGIQSGGPFNKFSGLFSGISIFDVDRGNRNPLGRYRRSQQHHVGYGARTDAGDRNPSGPRRQTENDHLPNHERKFRADLRFRNFGLALAIGILSLAETLLSSLTATPEGGGLQINTQISFGLALGSTGILILGSLLAGILPANRALSIKPSMPYVKNKQLLKTMI